MSDAYIGQLTLDGVVLFVRDGQGGILRKENLPENGKIENVLWRRADSSGKPASGMATFSGDDPYYVYAVPVDPQAGQAAETAADGRVTVEYAHPAHVVEATFDRDRAFQVASILLDNALKYTPEGGGVHVTVREKDGGALLEVSDSGVGIPKEKLPLRRFS